MKAYKNYMDRIRLDEEQHGRLMEAVKAAEAAEAAKKAGPEAEAPGKRRRFPLKRLGWIASAAAVIVLIVTVIPKNRLFDTPENKPVSEITAVTAASRTAAPEQDGKKRPNGEMQTQAAAEQNALTTSAHAPETPREPADFEGSTGPDSFLVICGTAEFSLDEAAPSSDVQTNSSTKTVEDYTEFTYTTQQPVLVLGQIREMVGEITDRMEEGDVSAKTSEDQMMTKTAECAEPADITGSAAVMEAACSEEPAESNESAACTEEAGTIDETVVFAIGKERFGYDAKAGLLSADGWEYRLTEEEKNELNSLLGSIFTDR